MKLRVRWQNSKLDEGRRDANDNMNSRQHALFYHSSRKGAKLVKDFQRTKGEDHEP
jgi:hypothetical protein